MDTSWAILKILESSVSDPVFITQKSDLYIIIEKKPVQIKGFTLHFVGNEENNKGKYN